MEPFNFYNCSPLSFYSSFPPDSPETKWRKIEAEEIRTDLEFDGPFPNSLGIDRDFKESAEIRPIPTLPLDIIKLIMRFTDNFCLRKLSYADKKTREFCLIEAEKRISSFNLIHKFDEECWNRYFSLECPPPDLNVTFKVLRWVSKSVEKKLFLYPQKGFTLITIPPSTMLSNIACNFPELLNVNVESGFIKEFFNKIPFNSSDRSIVVIVSNSIIKEKFRDTYSNTHDYFVRDCSPGGRKSIAPMALVTLSSIINIIAFPVLRPVNPTLSPLCFQNDHFISVCAKPYSDTTASGDVVERFSVSVNKKKKMPPNYKTFTNTELSWRSTESGFMICHRFV